MAQTEAEKLARLRDSLPGNYVVEYLYKAHIDQLKFRRRQALEAAKEIERELVALGELSRPQLIAKG